MSALDDVRRALDEAYGTAVIFDGLTGADLLAAVVADTELACRDAAAERDCLAMAVLFARQWSGGTPFELHMGIDDILATGPANAEKATAPAATATPDFFQPGHTYTEPGDTTDWKFRCDSITTHPKDGERTALGWRHFRGEWRECAYGEDDWEIHRLADAIGATEGGDR